jgi:uncharacterized protein (DUF885 family)
MAQLSGQSALRSAKPVSLLHGKYAPAAEPKGLRLLRDAARCLAEKFDQLLDGLKIREQKQILSPRFVVEEGLKEMTEFIGKPASENILATSFKSRAAKVAKLSDAKRADFQARVESAITNKVYPAYQKLIDYFRGVWPKTTTDDGVWKLPDGDAFYAYKLHENTTTTLKPDEVHKIGLREVARIEGEMRAISRCKRLCRATDRRGNG